MKGYTSRTHQGVPLGFEIRRQIGQDKIFRVRHGNGYYGSVAGELIQDKFNYYTPTAINNSEGSYARDFLREAVQAWQALSESAKNVWRAKEKSYRGTTGYALFISDYIRSNYAVASFIKDADGDSYETIEKTADCDTLELYLKNILIRKFHDDGILDLLKQSRVRAYRAAQQIISTDTYTKVEFTNESYDSQNEWDHTTNHRYTAKKAGACLIQSQLTYISTADQSECYILIYKNGGIILLRRICPSGPSPIAIILSDILTLAANDYIEIHTYQNTGVNRNIEAGSDRSFIAIHKLS